MIFLNGKGSNTRSLEGTVEEIGLIRLGAQHYIVETDEGDMNVREPQMRHKKRGGGLTRKRKGKGKGKSRKSRK